MYHCRRFGFRQPWCHKWKKKQSTKTHPVQRHVLIVSCSYALILAPASATFAIINPAGFAKTKSGTVLIMTMRDINLLFTVVSCHANIFLRCGFFRLIGKVSAVDELDS